MNNTTEPIDIIVCGHLCIDLYPAMGNVSAQQMVTPGRLLETGPMAISTGGVVSNTGLSLHRLGVNVCLNATVGDDLIGQLIVTYLKGRDLALTRHIATQTGLPGSYTIALTPGNNDRTFLHCTGTNDAFGIANVDFSLLNRAKIFHFGYPPLLPRMTRDGGAELTATFERAKAIGIVTSMDMVLPDPQGASGKIDWPLILKRSLPNVDIFMPSVEEILFMLRRKDFDAWQGSVPAHLTRAYLHDMADELLAMGAVIVGFKLGEMGLYMRTTTDVDRFARLGKLAVDPLKWSNFEGYTPAFQAQVAGTSGAGDSAYAGFLTALLNGLAPFDAMRMACAAGACNVEAVDSNSGVRSWAETQARVVAGWPNRPERLPGG